MYHCPLKEKMNKRHAEIGELLLTGNAKDYSEYRFLCGRARGLKEAISIIEQSFKGEIKDE